MNLSPVLLQWRSQSLTVELVYFQKSEYTGWWKTIRTILKTALARYTVSRPGVSQDSRSIEWLAEIDRRSTDVRVGDYIVTHLSPQESCSHWSCFKVTLNHQELRRYEYEKLTRRLWWHLSLLSESFPLQNSKTRKSWSWEDWPNKRVKDGQQLRKGTEQSRNNDKGLYYWWCLYSALHCLIFERIWWKSLLGRDQSVNLLLVHGYFRGVNGVSLHKRKIEAPCSPISMVMATHCLLINLWRWGEDMVRTNNTMIGTLFSWWSEWGFCNVGWLTIL